jgi:hypothetical protein
MIGLRVEQADEKSLRVTGLSPVLAHCLFQLPEILRQRDADDAQRRLFPDPLPSDPKATAEWHELSDADLHHLFISAEETILRDLTGLENGEVQFAVAHLPAWISALNQARLILGELYHVTDGDMERADLDPDDAKDTALLQIHVLGYLLQLLVERAQAA